MAKDNWEKTQKKLYDMVSIGVVDSRLNQFYDVFSTLALVANLVCAFASTFDSVKAAHGTLLFWVEELTVLFFALFWWTLHHGQTLWPQSLPRNLLTTYLGFPFAGFWSTDYFPVIPWFFQYVTGYLLHALTTAVRLPETFPPRLQDVVHTSHIPALAFLGRHCLLVYMLHQPVLYGMACIIAYVYHH